VGDLRKLLEGLDDDAPVRIPLYDAPHRTEPICKAAIRPSFERNQVVRDTDRTKLRDENGQVVYEDVVVPTTLILG